MVLFFVLMIIGAVAWGVADSADGWRAGLLFLIAVALLVSAAVRLSATLDSWADASPSGRESNAVATIAAATAAVPLATAESELLTLERAAATAAAAVKGGE